MSESGTIQLPGLPAAKGTHNDGSDPVHSSSEPESAISSGLSLGLAVTGRHRMASGV